MTLKSRMTKKVWHFTFVINIAGKSTDDVDTSFYTLIDARAQQK